MMIADEHGAACLHDPVMVKALSRALSTLRALDGHHQDEHVCACAESADVRGEVAQADR